jgi:putative ABC transport system ATP-binding protein
MEITILNQMIQTIELSKKFRANEIETTAIDKLTLDVKDGEFLAIMGPSGCGKSTLLNILGLLDNPSSGQLIFDGRDISRLTERNRTKLRKGNLGFVFQSFNLIDELSVEQNIELPLIYLKTPVKERRHMVHEIMELMGISQRARHYPRQLSGGQQQRVAIARAVVCKPKLILADEPTGNLDSVNGEEVMKLLTTLNDSGSTIIMVTHSMDQAKQAKRIIQLFDGHLISENIIKSTETIIK